MSCCATWYASVLAIHLISSLQLESAQNAVTLLANEGLKCLLHQKKRFNGDF